MTKSKFDKSTKENYTLPEIEKAFKNRDLLYVYAEQGDLDSVHLIVDSERAMIMANPTELQLKTVDIVWKQGNSLVEAGRVLGVTPQAVRFNIGLLKVKLKRVLDEWKIKDRGEITG